MKIAVLSPSKNRHAGGVERFSHLVAEALGVEHEVTIVDQNAATPSSEWIRRFGFSSAAASLKTRRRLRMIAPDLVISNGSAGWVWGPWKRIHVYHGTLVAHSWADRHGRRWRDWLLAGVIGGGLSEFASGWGASRVAVAQAAASEVRRFYRWQVDAVIWNCYLNEGLAKGPFLERTGLLYVGRRESRKGYEDAVEASRRTGTKLRVAGPGSDARTADLGLLDDVQLAAEYASASALIFPSRYEACSFVILEALAAGCPVITTRVGWVTELLERLPAYASLIVEPGDGASLERTIELVLSGDQASLAAVDEAGALVRSECSPDVFGGRWREIVRKATT